MSSTCMNSPESSINDSLSKKLLRLSQSVKPFGTMGHTYLKNYKVEDELGRFLLEQIRQIQPRRHSHNGAKREKNPHQEVAARSLQPRRLVPWSCYHPVLKPHAGLQNQLQATD